MFFWVKNGAQRGQEQNWAQSPTGTTCLIGKAPQICHSINTLQPLPAPPGAPKHPRWVYSTLVPPKYKISRPQLRPNSEYTIRPPFLILFTSIYYRLPPCPAAPPYYTPPPFHPAPSASQPLYPPNQKTLLLILTSPAPWQYSIFLGGGVLPICIYEVSWVKPQIDT